MNCRTKVPLPLLTGRFSLVGLLAGLAVACAVAARASSASAKRESADIPPAVGANSDRDASKPFRIGTYDSRAVAVAFVRSDMNAKMMQELVHQRDDARKAGDTRRVKELEARGEAMQVRKHMQGFSTAPVDDIMQQVQDRLAGVAAAAGVVVITRDLDYHASDIEVVDVTDALVALFVPDEQTLRIIADVRSRDPVALETIAKLPANE